MMLQGPFDHDQERGAWTSISTSDGRRVGSFLDRGKLGVEAYDANDDLLDVFEDVKDAEYAISECWDRNGGDAPPESSDEPHPTVLAKKAPPPLKMELTRFTKDGGPLTKRISLNANGS
jgi:hypothetical protein